MTEPSTQTSQTTAPPGTTDTAETAVGTTDRTGRTAADLDAATAPESTAPESTDAPGAGTPAEIAKLEEIEEAMRDVVDPELGINVVDLGLVYDIHVEPDNTATIDMTLTSAACPLTDVIEEQTSMALTGGAGADGVVDDFRINWVWMPPWGPQMITDDGREQLRALGFTV